MPLLGGCCSQHKTALKHSAYELIHSGGEWLTRAETKHTMMIASFDDCLIVIWDASNRLAQRVENQPDLDRSIHLVGTGGALVVSVLSGEKDLAGLVNRELGDLALRRSDGKVSRLAVLAILSDLVDVDAPSLAVDSLDLALLAFTAVLLAAGFDEHGVALPDGDAAALVLVSELLAETAAHELSADVARGREVSLAGLSSLAGHGSVGLHVMEEYEVNNNSGL